MHTLQKLFMPDGQKFYKLFDEVADNLLIMSSEFYDAIFKLTAFDHHLKRLDELEQQNDVVTHKLFIELGRNFITPFDREDIHFLASGLDDIADLQYGVVRQMKSYGLQNPGSTSQYVAAEVRNYTNILVLALKGLQDKRSLPKLEQPCLDMRKIILNCDSRIDSAISGLFPEYDDAVQIIKWMEHFEMLRALIQKCENAVNTIESIIIKYE